MTTSRRNLTRICQLLLTCLNICDCSIHHLWLHVKILKNFISYHFSIQISTIDTLKHELPSYTAAVDVSSQTDKTDWWKRMQESTLISTIISCIGESIPYFVKFIQNRQEESLRDHIQTSVMIQYNSPCDTV